MKSKPFQEKIDILVEKLFLWIIPKWVMPNWLSYFRILTVPFIGWLLYNGDIKSALILFLISASTDFLDGAMARRRDQITDLGKVIDPIADKMLIGVMLAFLAFDYLVVKVFLIFIAFEIIAVLSGTVLAYKFGRPVGANFWGKVKMILQSISVFLLLFGVIIHKNILITLSEYTLSVALFFAVMAGIEVYRRKHRIVKKHLIAFIKSI